MTAPGERLTPQQMRAEWDKRFPFTSAIAADPYQAAGFVDRVLAAWQADREALRRAIDTLQPLLREPCGPTTRMQARAVLAELDAAQGETT